MDVYYVHCMSVLLALVLNYCIDSTKLKHYTNQWTI
jgi:hypothetical protein